MTKSWWHESNHSLARTPRATSDWESKSSIADFKRPSPLSTATTSSSQVTREETNLTWGCLDKLWSQFKIFSIILTIFDLISGGQAGRLRVSARRLDMKGRSSEARDGSLHWCCIQLISTFLSCTSQVSRMFKSNIFDKLLVNTWARRSRPVLRPQQLRLSTGKEKLIRRLSLECLYSRDLGVGWVEKGGDETETSLLLDTEGKSGRVLCVAHDGGDQPWERWWW